MAYERKVGRHLKRMLQRGQIEGELFLGQWLCYSDANGIGYAQPDAFVVQEHLVVIFEAKLTQTDLARIQLLSLYAPLLKAIFNRPCVCIQVCKNLRAIPAKRIDAPQDLITHPRPGMWTWHYLGN